MIITNPATEVIYFKVYKDYFDFPRNKTSPHNSLRSYIRKTEGNGGIYFLEYDFYVTDDYTKEPFFVYTTKSSFSFVVENEEKDLIDLGNQKAMVRQETMQFIKENSLGYPYDNLDSMFNLYTTLDLLSNQGFY